jgi:hypothetical protein
MGALWDVKPHSLIEGIAILEEPVNIRLHVVLYRHPLIRLEGYVYKPHSETSGGLPNNVEVEQPRNMRDLRLPPWRSRRLRSSGMLPSVC